MKLFRKIFVLILVFVLGFSTGITLYKLNIPPIPQLKFVQYFFLKPDRFKRLVEGEIEVFVLKYTKGMRLFSNRSYVDTLGPKELEGLTLIQIPRHYRDKIRIAAKKPLTVYRLITSSNDNWLLEEYEKTDLKVNVVGTTCTFSGVVKKTFPPGFIDLYAGGPTSASPVLISQEENEISPMTLYIK